MDTRVAAGGTLIRRYALALAPAGAGIEAAVTAASVPPLSGGPGSHGSGAAHAFTIADSVAEPAASLLSLRTLRSIGPEDLCHDHRDKGTRTVSADLTQPRSGPAAGTARHLRQRPVSSRAWTPGLHRRVGAPPTARRRRIAPARRCGRRGLRCGPVSRLRRGDLAERERSRGPDHGEFLHCGARPPARRASQSRRLRHHPRCAVDGRGGAFA
jgi:hypothetical protein